MIKSANPCSLRILLVDDEPDLHLASAEVLRDAGHEVHIARDGEQALATMTAMEIDVLLTDVRLPKLDGMSLFRLTLARLDSSNSLSAARPPCVD